jgi:hypothetical protein
LGRSIMYKRYKDVHPEGKLIRKEFLIRKMDLPPEMLNRRRQLLRWVAIALGLISPGDERSGILDVLDALFYYTYSKEIAPTPQEILVFVNKRRSERGEKPVVLEAVRYHLRRLEAYGIIEKTKSRGASYVFTRDVESSLSDPSSFVDHIFSEMAQTKNLIKRAVGALVSLYR